MTILTIAVSITAPALANFFRGRTLDSEARRLLSLTRQGQSRAVSEGIPTELWINVPDGTFGLEAQPAYEPTDSKAVEVRVDSDIHVEVVNGTSAAQSGTFGASGINTSASVRSVQSKHPNLPKIRFMPDGTVDDSSPQSVRFTGRDGSSIWVTQSRNHSTYEIRSVHP